MDSGNSGSLPSSSGGEGGGDEAYDETIRNDQTLFAMQQQPNLPPSTFFDTTSFSHQNNHLINPNPNLTNPMYNLDSLWTRNPNNLNNTNNQNPNNQNLNLVFNAQNPVFNPQNPVEPDGTGPGSNKNPKKRTRASRRAPTTVLTTDTTNFRQMVQEFTGIPTVPFAATSSSSSPFTRQHHLNLYNNNSTSTIQRPSYMMNMNGSNNTSIFNLSPSEIPSFTKQPLNLSSLQNQLFPFQTVVGENRNLEGSTSSSVKRWRGESENMGNVQNGVVLGRNEGGEQLPGNEDSWNLCPSD